MLILVFKFAVCYNYGVLNKKHFGRYTFEIYSNLFEIPIFIK